MSVNIVGAGIAGLSSAICLARKGLSSNLISLQPSERSQSVMAEGGINASLDTMGDNDSVEEHFRDTIKGGCNIADETAVRGLCEAAPGIVSELVRLGAPLEMKDGVIMQRYFGGQKKRRTAYAKSSTGKIIMTALINECRKYEAAGLVKRYTGYRLSDIVVSDKTSCDAARDVCCAQASQRTLSGINITNIYSGEELFLPGKTILATGGLTGLFAGLTTGSLANDSDAAAIAFKKGVAFSNLEFIQYHPTTVPISGKRLLISEAARGEGGRLCTYRSGELWYFMEDKYPELGNLMPRDVVSREEYAVINDPACDGRIYLDMRKISKSVFKGRLSDLRSEIIDYLGLDPMKKIIPVSPGIHYFMGGIKVNIDHETNIKGLYAAGECAAQYHGANRLGGNSLLAAAYGGQKAADAVIASGETPDEVSRADSGAKESGYVDADRELFENELSAVMGKAMAIVRDEASLTEGLAALEELKKKFKAPNQTGRLRLAEAMIMSAISRKESRGAHYRSDYPAASEEYALPSCVFYENDSIIVKMD